MSKKYKSWYDEDEDYNNTYYSGRSSYNSPYYNNEGDYFSHRRGRGWNNWNSWNNYGENTKNEGIDTSLVIKEPEGYMTPSKSEIAKKGIKIGERRAYYSNYNNYIYSEYELKDESAKFIKNLSRYFYHELMENDLEKVYVDNSEDNKDRQKIELVIDRIKDIRTPFITPLEKSVYFHNKLDISSLEKVKEEDKIKEIVKKLKNLDVDEEALNDFQLQEMLKDMLVIGGNKGGDPQDESSLFSVSYKNIDRFSILDKISLIKSWGEAFKISKEITKEVVYNSPKNENMHITSIEQIIHMDLYNILFPNFNYKLATNNLFVNLPVKTEERKQKIIMLLDDSGSMSDPLKIEWVFALLTERLKECIKGEAEVFVSKFETGVTQSRFKFHHIFDQKSYDEFKVNFKYTPNGGDTGIGYIIDYLADEINNKKKLHNLNIDLSKDKVEILVINDGQDSIKTDKFKYKTNAVSILSSNEELKKLCLNNKGKYIYIENEKEIKEFE